MTETKTTRNPELDSPSQPKGTTKTVDSAAVLKAQHSDEEVPFDEREFVSSDGTSHAQFFSPEDKEEESRTGPSSDVSSLTTTIIATTETEAITTEKRNSSLDQRQDENDSSTDKSKKSKKVSISKLIQGKREQIKKQQQEDDSKVSTTSKESQISELDDEIALIREGSSETITQRRPAPPLDDLDDAISRVREGPPLLPAALSNVVDLDDEIFQVREVKQNQPKSILKKATDPISTNKVRFAHSSQKKEAIDLDMRKIDINTLVDSLDDDDDFIMDGNAQASSEIGATSFLNDLQTNSVDFDASDGHSVESYDDSLGSADTDGQSVHLYDCWELACV